MVAASLVALAGTAVVGALLGAERIDGADSLFDADALPQLFVVFRVGLVYGALIPLLLGLAVAVVPLQVGARSLAFPRLAAAGFWAWLGGFVVVMVSLADNGGPGGGNAKMVDLFIAGHGLLVVGLAAPGRVGRRHGADDTGAGDADVTRAVLRLVGADRVDRPPARPPGRARDPRLPVRRPPQRPGAVRRQRRRRLVDRLRPDPAGDVPVRPPGHRHRRRARRTDVPQADAAARRRLRRAGDRRRRRPVGRHPAGLPRPPVVRLRARPRRLRPEVRRPPAVRHVHAAADPRRASSSWGSARWPPSPTAHGSARTSPRRSCSPSSASAWCSSACSAARCCRSPTSGCRAPSSRRRRSCTSSTAACSAASAAWPGGCPSSPGAPCRPVPASASPCSACWPPCSPRCRTTSPASPISRRPPGPTTTTARPALWNVAVTAGHALMLVVVLAFAGLVLRPVAARRRRSATTRRAGRRSSG